MLRKVICSICGWTFKVEQEPPPTIVAFVGHNLNGQVADPFRDSSLQLTSGPEGIEYCRRMCPDCSLKGQPG